MSLEEILDDMESEELEKQRLAEWKKKHHIAIRWNWNFTNFKRFASHFLKRNNNEDQWIFDYESWVDTLKLDGEYKHPSEWCEFYYQEDWDTEKMKKSLLSMKK